MELDIAHSQFIPGFAEAIVGHKVGDKFDAKLTFPKDYHTAKYAGKKVVFKITVKAIVKNTASEFNDAWVKKNSKFKTTEEYRNDVKKQLLKDKKNEASDAEKNEVFSQLVSKSKVKKYPEKELDNRYNKVIDTYKDLAKQNNVKYEKYLKTNMGMSKKEFAKEAKTAAKNTVKQELVLYAVARKENVKITNSEYDKFLKGILKDAGYDKKSYKDASGMTIEQYAEKNNIHITMLYKEVMNKVMKVSKAK